MIRVPCIILSLAFLFALSCGTVRHAAQQTDATLADSLWTYSQTHPDGFTLNVSSWTEPSTGIAVAYKTTQSSHDKTGLNYVITHAQSHEGYVGGWFNSADSLYYFDSVRIFPEDSLSAAINFGKANHQEAIYKLSSSEEIRLIEDVEYVSKTNLIIMYDKEIGKEHLLKAVKEYGAELLYDYSIIPGIAIKIPEGTDIQKAIDSGAGLVFLSGQLPIDPATGVFPEGGIREQTRQSILNAQAILQEAGLSLSNVVKTTVFLADMGDFASMNEVYAQFFASPFPARSAVAVKTLPKGALVEIECIVAK